MLFIPGALIFPLDKAAAFVENGRNLSADRRPADEQTRGYRIVTKTAAQSANGGRTNPSAASCLAVSTLTLGLILLA